MGKSLNFVKKRILTGECNGMENNNWVYLKEVSFLDIWNSEYINLKDHSLPKIFNYRFENDNNKEHTMDMTLEYNDNADFQYFSTERCICDGTMLFEIENMLHVINKIINLKTYCTDVIFPNDFEDSPWKYNLKYTVGNFVIGMEKDDKFSTKDKPWMTCRFTAMLPIKMEFVRNNNE